MPINKEDLETLLKETEEKLVLSVIYRKGMVFICKEKYKDIESLKHFFPINSKDQYVVVYSEFPILLGLLLVEKVRLKISQTDNGKRLNPNTTLVHLESIIDLYKQINQMNIEDNQKDYINKQIHLTNHLIDKLKVSLKSHF